MHTQAWRLRSHAPALVVGLIALMCIIAVYQGPRALRVDIGGSDDALTRNFFIPEQSPSYTFRWSRDTSDVFLRGVSAGTHTLTIGAAAPRPAGIAAPRVEVILDDRSLGQVAVQPTYQRLTFNVTIPWDALGDHTVQIRSETFKEQTRAARDLGIAVDDVVISPDGWPQVPPLVPLLTFVLDALLIYAIAARWLPRAAFVAAIACVCVGALYQVGLRQPIGPPAFQLFSPLLFVWGTLALMDRLKRNGAEQTWAAVATVATCTAALSAGSFLLLIHTSPATDFHVFYTAATRLRERDFGNVYDLNLIKIDPTFSAYQIYKQPPLPAVALEPLSLLREGNAVLIWRSLLVVAVAASLGLLARELRLGEIGMPSGWPLIAMLVLAMLWSPLRDSIRLGQWDGVLLILLTLAFIGVRRNLPSLTGSAIALAGIIKLYPFYAVVFLIAKRQWRALGWLVGALLAFAGLSIVGSGWSINAYFARTVLPAVSGTTDNPENQTLASLIIRLSGNHLPMTVMTTGALLIVTVPLIWHIRQHLDRRTPAFALDYGLMICAMLLSTPVAWMHYEVILFIPLAIVLCRLADRPPVSAGWLAVAAGAVALLTFGNERTLLASLLYPSRDLTRAFLQSTRVFAQIGFALSVWYLATLREEPASQPIADPDLVAVV